MNKKALYIFIDSNIFLNFYDFYKEDIERLAQLVELVEGGDINDLLTTAKLRLTVTPFCNFNCRAPGAQQGWCMEEPGEFVYPKIRASLLKKE